MATLFRKLEKKKKSRKVILLLQKIQKWSVGKESSGGMGGTKNFCKGRARNFAVVGVKNFDGKCVGGIQVSSQQGQTGGAGGAGPEETGQIDGKPFFGVCGCSNPPPGSAKSPGLNMAR